VAQRVSTFITAAQMSLSSPHCDPAAWFYSVVSKNRERERAGGVAEHKGAAECPVRPALLRLSLALGCPARLEVLGSSSGPSRHPLLAAGGRGLRPVRV
jgi:hypothetical protein